MKKKMLNPFPLQGMAFVLVLSSYIMTSHAQGTWGDVATVSETTAGYLCAYDPDGDGDTNLDCSTLMPYISNTGVVGIGTSAPSRTLTVSGTTWVSKLELQTVSGAAVPVSISTEASAEVDPEVGTLGASGQWCTTDGSTINCTSDAPTGSDNLGDHTATTTLDMNSQDITNAIDVGATNISVTGNLTVADTFQVGNATIDCSDPSHRGRIRVDPLTDKMQICN